MKSIIVAASILSIFVLTSCTEHTKAQRPALIKEVTRVVKPPEALYNCPLLRNWPDADKLTDIQVARILTTLHQNNLTCHSNIQAIKTFLDKAEAQFGSVYQK